MLTTPRSCRATIAVFTTNKDATASRDVAPGVGDVAMVRGDVAADAGGLAGPPWAKDSITLSEIRI